MVSIILGGGIFRSNWWSHSVKRDRDFQKQRTRDAETKRNRHEGGKEREREKWKTRNRQGQDKEREREKWKTRNRQGQDKENTSRDREREMCLNIHAQGKA